MIVPVFIPLVYHQFRGTLLPHVDTVADLSGSLKGRTVHTVSDQVVLPRKVIHALGDEPSEHLRCEPDRIVAAANPETFGGIGRQRNLKNQTLRLAHPGGYHLTGERISRLIQHKEFSGSGLGQSGLHFAPRHLNRLSGSIRINRIGHVDHHVAFPCTRKTDRCTRQNCK